MTQKKLNALNPLPIIFALFLLILLGGCTQSLLPSQKQVVSGTGITSAWNSYDEAMSFYEGIVPYQTTFTQLREEQNADFKASQNIEELGPTAVRNFFLQNQSIKVRDLPSGVQDCLENHEICRGYRARKEIQYSKGVGSLFLRMLSFRSQDIVTGWAIELLFLAKNDLIIYKEALTGTPGGKAGFEMSQKPLGPVQEPLDHAGRLVPRPSF